MIKNIISFCSKRPLLILIGVLVILSLYDLISPPINRVMWRQTQTAMLTDNFVKEGFSINGLYINLDGPKKLMTVYEFPLYNFIVGALFFIFNNDIFWGKLVSLIASIISLTILFKLLKKHFGETIAKIGAFFFVFSPVGMLIRTSFQPDALGMMFLLIALNYLFIWKKRMHGQHFMLFAFSLLLASLMKVTSIVPYLPIMGLAVLYDQKKWRCPKLHELIIIVFLVIIPFIVWYMIRGQITDPSQMIDDSKFFIGDLSRFFVVGYYIKLSYTSVMFLWCGIGLLLFLLGIIGSTVLQIALLVGVLLYFILIPTAWYQYYYFYAIVPIVALFMARGYLRLYNYCSLRKLLIVIYCCIILFVGGFAVATEFVLKHDNIMLLAAHAVRDVSCPSDLILSINIHDRGIAIGGRNTSLFYLANRKGWAIRGDYAKSDEILKQIDLEREKGAKWLVITWYTSDLEPWYAFCIPKAFSRDPRVNGKQLFSILSRSYKTVFLGDNYAVMKLI